MRAKNTLIARLGACILSAACASGANATRPFQTDPGDYDPIPPGLTLSLTYLQSYRINDIKSGGNSLIPGYGLRGTLGLQRIVHTTQMGGMLVGFQAGVPYFHQRDDFGTYKGFGDAFVGVTALPINDAKSGEALGFTALLAGPTGRYRDADTFSNPSQNRYALMLKSAYARQLSPNFKFEIIGEVAAFGVNDRFGQSGVRLKTDPTLGLDVHLRYVIDPASNVGMSYYFTGGGKKTVNGIQPPGPFGSLNTSSALISYTRFLAQDLGLLFQYGRDVRAKEGAQFDRTLNVRLLKIF